jgi:hypothetical protein
VRLARLGTLALVTALTMTIGRTVPSPFVQAFLLFGVTVYGMVAMVMWSVIEGSPEP